jgi:hypothetical protein
MAGQYGERKVPWTMLKKYNPPTYKNWKTVADEWKLIIYMLHTHNSSSSITFRHEMSKLLCDCWFKLTLLTPGHSIL